MLWSFVGGKVNWSALCDIEKSHWMTMDGIINDLFCGRLSVGGLRCYSLTELAIVNYSENTKKQWWPSHTHPHTRWRAKLNWMANNNIFSEQLILIHGVLTRTFIVHFRQIAVFSPAAVRGQRAPTWATSATKEVSLSSIRVVQRKSCRVSWGSFLWCGQRLLGGGDTGSLWGSRVENMLTVEYHWFSVKEELKKGRRLINNCRQ